MCSGSVGSTTTLGSLLGNGSSQSSRRSAVGSPVAVHSSTEGLLGGDFWVTNGCLASSAAAGPARPTSRSAAVATSSRRVRTIAEPPPISAIAWTLPLLSSQECHKQTNDKLAGESESPWQRWRRTSSRASPRLLTARDSAGISTCRSPADPAGTARPHPYQACSRDAFKLVGGGTTKSRPPRQ